MGTTLNYGIAKPAYRDPFRSPRGWFVMQEVGAQNVKDNKLTHPKVSGLCLREKWNRLNPKLGVYNWSFLDKQIDRCVKTNRDIILSIYTGSNAPLWIAGPKFGPSDNVAPYPFDTRMLDAYAVMIEKVGAQYKNESHIVGIEIGGPTCPDMSIEMHYTHSPQKLKGYSEQAMIDAWKACGQEVAKAFPQCAIITDGGPAPGGNRGTRVNTPFYDFMFKEYANRFFVTHCALKANTSISAPHHKLVTDHKKRGGRTGFEAACGQLDGNGRPIKRFGGAWPKARQIAAAAGAEFIKFYQWDVDVLPNFS